MDNPLSLLVSRPGQGLRLRPLARRDDAALAALIRVVSAEYGLTADRGFSVADPHLDRLSEVYDKPGAGYWVVTDEAGQLLGGAGLGPVAGHPRVCELQKMYLAAPARGLGLGRQLAQQVLDQARRLGYRYCYLETTACLEEALALYRRLGFTPCERLGDTGHHDCELTLMRPLG
ncbi:GNAT family N-acetyltransferase [Zobellella denitrificans]|uniref:GNAT family N-acetyltransferase n=1 Tax=Zobellella denitrificans TaxID=347534 RepID=UPI000B8C0B7E|nr:GNAT family N-acetyltransferase [Zobellella denitrificans]OXS14681.1 GNAT family N-acetyltransferase [Zobellella denitrificans]